MKLEKSIRSKIEKAFQPSFFELENESSKHHRPPGSETHFRLLVVADIFEGVSRVDRQRQVAALFDEERSQGLHALSQRVYTAKEWAEAQNKTDLKTPDCRDGLRWDPLVKPKCK